MKKENAIQKVLRRQREFFQKMRESTRPHNPYTKVIPLVRTRPKLPFRHRPP